MAGRFFTLSLDVPASAPTNGAGKDVRFLTNKTVQVDAPAGANWTIVVQGTIDGDIWETLATYASVGGFLAVPESLRQIRVRTTAFVANAPTVEVGGNNARDEGP